MQLNEGEFVSRIQANESASKPKPLNIKLVLATPTYGPVDPRHAKHLRAAIMTASNYGVQWIGDVSGDRMGWEATRNLSAKAALETEADGIVWVDSDIIMQPDAIAKLVSYGHDFVSGVYFQREGSHFPLVANYDKDLDSFRWVVRWPTGVIFPADGVGFGFCYTSCNLLRRMRDELPEVKKDGWFKFRKFSEDFGFSLNAVKLGCPPYVDTGLLLGHLGNSYEVTIKDFKAKNDYAEGTGDPLVPTVQETQVV